MNRKKKFRLFDMNRDGRGVDKVEDGPKNFTNFFKLFGRKFSRLLSLNLMMTFLVIPILIVAAVYILGPTIKTPESLLYPTLYGASMFARTPATDLLFMADATQLAVPVYNSYVYYVIGIVAVIYIVTFGWQNVGSTYILRGLVRGDPVFLISDYFYAIKKNLRQGFWLGVIDCVAIALLAVDFMFFYAQPNSYMLDVMYIVTVALIIIYVMMRFYIYLQVVTFNLSIWKIIKNAFIFTALGIKRNVLAIFGIIFVAAVNVALIILLLPLNIIIPLILPLFYFLGTAGFIKVYAAYPVIEKYMIEPELKVENDDEISENE